MRGVQKGLLIEPSDDGVFDCGGEAVTDVEVASYVGRGDDHHVWLLGSTDYVGRVRVEVLLLFPVLHPVLFDVLRLVFFQHCFVAAFSRDRLFQGYSWQRFILSFKSHFFQVTRNLLSARSRSFV